jgi:pSer/pThr/pTyr-binding forkhead associated (FHA) protein
MVMEPNGVQRALPLPAQGLTIGRSSENGLVVNYPDISRRHTHIAFDGRDCYVTDLESGNGTYLGNSRLQPHEPTIWTPGTPLRIGGVKVQLVSGTASGPLAPEPAADRPGSRQRQETDTFIGSADPTAETGQSRGWMWLIVALAGLGLCGCLGLGVVGYLYWGL